MEAFVIIIFIAIIALSFWIRERARKARKEYYHNYLDTDAWKRKRYVVLKRDNWTCHYCGAPATQVHHLRYAKNIGNEPIKWLVAVCQSCHESKSQ